MNNIIKGASTNYVQIYLREQLKVKIIPQIKS